MYKRELPRVSPESEGISSRKILEMLTRLEACQNTELHGFMLQRHGKVVAEGWWKPYDKDTVHINHSFGKSYIATAIGVACTEGLIRVEDRIVDLFEEEIAKLHINVSDNLRKLKIKHVLSMSNGMAVHAATGANVLFNYLSCPVDAEPGSTFMYNTAGSCILGAIIQKVTGGTVRAYMTPRIFEKIGLECDKLGWLSFANGLNAAPGVSATTENNLRLGMLYLNGGTWNGERLIDANWIRQATTKQIENDQSGEESIDGRSGYGYQLWMDRIPGVYRFDGGHGQICIMSPKDGLALAIHQAASMPKGTSEVFDILHEYFFTSPLPDTPLAEDPQGWQRLKDYLASRELAKPESRPLPSNYQDFNGIYRICEGGFHINPELRPSDSVNVYEDFYDNTSGNVRTLSLRFLSETTLEVVLDGNCRLEVRLDGKIVPVRTKCALPTYYLTFSNGWFENENTLQIMTRYFQTCFTTWLRFVKTSSGFSIRARKNSLHDQQPYFDSFATFERVL